MKNDKSGKINSGTVLLAFFAIIAGLAGAYTVRVAMAQTPEIEVPPPPPPPPPKRPLKITTPLASRDLKAGTQVFLDDIALYRMTRQEISDSIDAKTFMTNPEQIIGKVLAADLPRGKTFDTRNLLPAGKVPGVSSRLKPGLRAVTVLMTPENALMGFASPGQHVDVLFHYGQGDGKEGGIPGGNGVSGFAPGHHDFNPPRRRDYYGNAIGGSSMLDSLDFVSATSTLIQDIEVLALGMYSAQTNLASELPAEEQVRITLAVAPRQAEILRVAAGHGELSLTLRGPEDEQQVSLVNPVTLKQIIDVDSTVHEMEIYRGKQLSKIQFGVDHVIKQRVFADDNSRGGPPGPYAPTPVSTDAYAPSPYDRAPIGAYAGRPDASQRAHAQQAEPKQKAGR